ncbi:endonuclease/exonuclease/phosphatase family protein [Haloferula sp. BvORR071]|uniref:endonuclease/exonuclease/phosphatase family protein n=1 Tax=Haloferula sp. BvORR071 TaxID=1396141 RepID=UPI000558FC05|nr:endonuclease/exonuclease/phosphatase family protein [Haloferula sp. BvORR071]
MNFRKLALSLAALLTLGLPASATIIGTYNIRYDNNGDIKAGNSWERRAPIIAGLIKFHDFDLLGTQEGEPQQMDDLCKLLGDYGCSMHGRDDGKHAGEHIGIFFKKEKFEMLDDGFFWISPTPDQPGVGWDAQLPRICGWAKLKRKADAKTVFVFSTHLDHRGKESRKEGAALILKKIEEIAGQDPVYLMGDFNSDQHSEAYRMFQESPRFADSYEIAKVRYALNGTPNKFDTNAMTESRIDHVFVGKAVPVRRYGVLTDSYRVPKTPDPEESKSGNFPSEVTFEGYEARLPSDHFPVLIETVD